MGLPNNLRGEGHILSRVLLRAVCFLLLTRIAYTTKKRLPDRVGEPQSVRRLERCIAWFRAIAGVRTGRCCWRFRFGAAEPANGIRTHAPERNLRGLGLLALAVLALVR